MLRRIDAPGIQINEIDRSQYGMPDYSIVGTTCLICGFADKGENYSIKWINTIQTLVDNYGYPQTEEERYFWNACAEVLNKGGICLAAKLPYVNDALTTLPYVEYQILPIQQNNKNKKYSNIIELDKSLSSYIELRQTASGYMSKDSYDKLVVDKSNLQVDKIKIVDITNSQYQSTSVKDSNKNVLDYECLGLMPVLVSPANALFYQHLLNCDTNTVAMSSTMYLNQPKVLEANENILSVYVESSSNEDTATVISSYVANKNCYELINTDDEHRQYKLTALVASDGVHVVPLTAIKIYDKERQLSSLFESITTEDQLIKQDDNACFYEAAHNYLSTYENGEYDEHTANIEIYSPIGGMHAVGKPAFSFNADAFAKQLSTNSINDYTVSREAAEILPSITIADNVVLDKDKLKLIGLALFKVTADPAESTKLQFTLIESYVGSLDNKAKTVDGNSLFIDNIVNSQSTNIRMFSNLNKIKQRMILDIIKGENNTVSYKMSDKTLTQHDHAAFYAIEPQSAAILGQTAERCNKNITYNTSILEGLNLIYDKACDKNKYYIDLVVDAGVSNIAQAYVNRKNPKINNSEYIQYGEDETALKSMKLDNSTLAPNAWKTVLQKYDTFCKNMRGDCMFIADGHRAFALDGDEKVVRDTAPNNNINTNVLPKLKWLNGLNTNYGAGYIDWFRGVDAWSGEPMWIPPSIKAAGIYIYTDAYWNMWDAPAGMNRGKVLNVIDCAFSPNQEEAGKIYNQCWNYACNYPIDGIILEGQKTFQRQKTAFDRVNVRRLFLYLEKEVSRIARYFLYEGNTAWQRQRFVDAISPLFENAKQRNGIIDYVIKCDEDNNTAQTIDNNELRCAIAIKPVKSIEFILLNFICTNQSASVVEEVLK